MVGFTSFNPPYKNSIYVNFKDKTLHSFTITALTTQGEGIARHEGKAVFIPYTLPGEEWEAQIIETHKNFNRAFPIRLVSCTENPSSKRIEPRCPHYGRCGGCQLQHVAYDDQLELKRSWLQETFKRIAHLDVDVRPLIYADAWEYRNKMTIPLIEIDGKVRYAFHHAYSPADFVAIKDCLIARREIRDLLSPVCDALHRISLGLMLHSVKNAHGSGISFRIANERKTVQLYNMKISPANRRLLKEILLGTVLDALIFPDFGESKETNHSSASTRSESDIFLQVNDSVCALLYDYVENLPFLGNESLLDGYCGVGLLTRKLARRFERVHGVESNRLSAQNAEIGVQNNELGEKVTIYQQTMEHYLRDRKEIYQTVILNPPRSGLSKQVRSRIPSLKANDIVMISCHPAALARDAAAFVDEGYQIESLQPFDMFPQTHHLETVIHLRKK
ncbi:MAG: class I SAM-dependent RNA methyltransferase [Candidatus Omnitrophota bacterium]|jgi:23S rRNA (uracil1939-C5)-methyltransferase|nr:MAG: class I SAM-dependent RNA methyltransferase [Candidatus Omnitrophota bacterium]